MFLPKLKDEPIIKSLDQNDFYKYPMHQVIFHKYSKVRVKYKLTNRTSNVRLADFIDLGELKENLDHTRTLVHSVTELHNLAGTFEYENFIFKPDYIKSMQNYRLPDYFAEAHDGQLILGCEDDWVNSEMWEIYMLSIVTALYTRKLMQGSSMFEQFALAQMNLAEKIKKLKHAIINEGLNITFSDFGTRRACFPWWQEYVVQIMKEEFPNHFLGTSNVRFARLYNVMPMGTNAHAPKMVMSGVIPNLIDSQKQELTDWEEEYGCGMYLALPDTYGTDFFLEKVFTQEQAFNWKGFRQDSGDPFEFGDKIILYYQSLGIDPKEKLIVFSDGLDVDKMIALARYFQGKIKCSFGWGTNLTNDIGFKTLSLVVKAVEANGVGLVKLSDNIAKAIGQPEDIARIKQEAGYDVVFNQACAN